MKRVKIVNGFNPDLIGKLATVQNEQNDGTIEVIVDGRPNQRYMIPANTVQNIDKQVDMVNKPLQSDDRVKKLLERMIMQSERFLNELKETYESFR